MEDLINEANEILIENDLTHALNSLLLLINIEKNG